MFSTSPTTSAATKVVLSIKCRNLERKQIFSKSDPAVGVFELNTNGKWAMIGKTERREDDEDPNFSDKITVDRVPGKNTILSFRVFQVTDRADLKPDKDQAICSVDVPLNELLLSSSGETTFTLNNPSGQKTKSTIIITATQTTSGSASSPAPFSVQSKGPSKVTFTIKCRKLERMELLSKSDPAVGVYAMDAFGKWQIVGKTERREDDQDPNFAALISLDRNPSKDTRLAFRVFQVKKSFKEIEGNTFARIAEFDEKNDRMFAQVETTLNELLASSSGETTMNLLDSKGSKIKSKMIINMVETKAPAAFVPKKLVLTLKCRQLERQQLFSKSDPAIGVFSQSASGQWQMIGHTERREDDQEPNFANTVTVENTANKDTLLKFGVYQVSSRERDIGGFVLKPDSDKMFMYCEVNLSVLLAATTPEISFRLLNDRGIKTNSTLVIGIGNAGGVLPWKDVTVRVDVACKNLADSAAGVFPLVALYVEDSEDKGKLKLVGMTEKGGMVKTDPNPKFAKNWLIRVTEADRQVKWVVYDVDPFAKVDAKGNYELHDNKVLGEATMSLRQFHKQVVPRIGASVDLPLRGKGVKFDSLLQVNLLEVREPKGSPETAAPTLAPTMAPNPASLMNVDPTREPPARTPQQPEPEIIPIQEPQNDREGSNRKIRVSCQEMLFPDGSKNEVVVALYAEDVTMGKFMLVGQSEMVRYTRRADFEHLFMVWQNPSRDRKLKFVFYDVTRAVVLMNQGRREFELHPSDEIGSATVSYNKLVLKVVKHPIVSYPLSHARILPERPSMLHLSLVDDQPYALPKHPSEPTLDERDVRIGVSVRAFPRTGKQYKSNPAVSLFIRENDGVFGYQDSTERVAGRQDTSFLKTFVVRQEPTQATKMKFVLADVGNWRDFGKWINMLQDSKKGGRRGREELPTDVWRTAAHGTKNVGVVDIMLEEFLERVELGSAHELAVEVLDHTGEPLNRGRCFLVLKLLPVVRTLAIKGDVRYSLAVSNMQNDRDIFERVSPVISVYYRDHESGDFIYRGQSERLTANPNPVFRESFQIDELKEFDQHIQLLVWNVPEQNKGLKMDHDLSKGWHGAENLIGVANVHLSDLLHKLPADGRVAFPLVNEDGVQVNDCRAEVLVTVTNAQSRYFSSAQLEERAMRAAEEENHHKVWIKFCDERPIKVGFSPHTSVDTFERELLLELRTRYGPRIYNIAIQKIHRANPRMGHRPQTEFLDGNMKIEEAVKSITFENPLLIISKGEVASGGQVGSDAIFADEVYLASSEKMRRDQSRSSFIWTLLWHKQHKLRIPISETHIFCNGVYSAHMFSSSTHGQEICKVRPQSSIEKLRHRLLRLAEEDEHNTSTYCAVVVHSDTRSTVVTKQSLARVLRHITIEPANTVAQFGAEPLVNQWKLVKPFITPVAGARYVSTFLLVDPSVATRTQSTKHKAWGSGTSKLLFAAEGCRCTGGCNCHDHTSAQHGSLPNGRSVENYDNYEIRTRVHSYVSRYGVDKMEQPSSNFDQFDDVDVLHKLQDEHHVAKREEMDLDCHCSNPRSCVHICDLSKPVPQSVIRETRKMILAVVNYLKDCHGLECTQIKCEFVLSGDKQMVLHSLYDVKFRNEARYEQILNNNLLVDMAGLSAPSASLQMSDGYMATASTHFQSTSGIRSSARPKTSHKEATQIEKMPSTRSQFPLDLTVFEEQNTLSHGLSQGKPTDPTKKVANWKRLCLQANEEILALNNEILTKESAWARERLDLSNRIVGLEHVAREAKQHVTDKTLAMGEFISNMKNETDAIKEQKIHLQNLTRTMEPKKDKRNHRDELEIINELAQMLDLFRDLVPKTFEHVRMMVEEVRGPNVADELIDTYAFNPSWAKLKRAVLEKNKKDSLLAARQETNKGKALRRR